MFSMFSGIFTFSFFFLSVILPLSSARLYIDVLPWIDYYYYFLLILTVESLFTTNLEGDKIGAITCGAFDVAFP